MKLNSLQDLMVDEVRDLYSAEKQLVKALPKMAKAATSPRLKTLLQEHLAETENHVKRLEQVFQHLGLNARAKKCKGMEGLIQEGSDMLEEDADPEVLDAAIIGSGNRVEHYEIAAYGTVRTYAQILGNQQIANLFQQTLDEEGNADKKLTALAESSINVEAASGAGKSR
jgi:ferritin-like metal-binding protein YciE